ncbi:hypothetical protein LINPERHAP1_LOCUS4502 [Linum perenne]
MDMLSRQHSQMRMETLDILLAEKFTDYWSLVKQVLKFAMERRVEKIHVISHLPGELRAAARIHANFSYKSLRLIGMEIEQQIDCHSYFLPYLASLRILCLENISARFLMSVIARCSLLEIVDIVGHVSDFKKLQISDLPHLKTLKTLTCEEMEIEAPRLQNLHLSCRQPVQKLSLRAPQVKHLEIMYFDVNFLNAVISELPSLKTLTLSGHERVMKKLKLSIPKLEVFKLLGLPNIFEKIEFGGGPTMSRFFLYSYSLGDLRKCEIDNANANASEGRYRSYLGFVKDFTRAAPPQCQTVSITNLDDEHNVPFIENTRGVKLRNTRSINHLKYCTGQSNSKVDKRALLESLFRVCYPKHLTIIHRHKNSKRFFQGLVRLMQQSLSNESLTRLNGLKDVKIIITRDFDVEIEVEEEEEWMMGYSKCKTQNQLCLELTWLH